MLARKQLAAKEGEETGEAEKPSSADRLKGRRLQAEQRHAERSRRRKGFASVPLGPAEASEGAGL